MLAPIGKAATTFSTISGGTAPCSGAGDHAPCSTFITRFRNLAAPLTVARPMRTSTQNAAAPASPAPIEVGNRWEELAGQAEARIGDCLWPSSPFRIG